MTGAFPGFRCGVLVMVKRPCGSSWKTRSVFQGAVGEVCASTATAASTGRSVCDVPAPEWPSAAPSQGFSSLNHYGQMTSVHMRDLPAVGRWGPKAGLGTLALTLGSALIGVIMPLWHRHASFLHPRDKLAKVTHTNLIGEPYLIGFVFVSL